MSKLILLTVLMVLLTGCAGIRYNKDGSVDSYGILRTMTISYYEDGSIKAISTDSTTKDVLLGLNELADTAANTAAKAIP